ncbi:phytanoyl-CoA dioxygenase PhyH [Paenibacillus cellulosilyticus]|uniref:Phytanoyl-CoA dioxygenase PhyH n=1 Tax=Paenibacillus cellulosilyticus TaxID=375489 RepID=A0A2V2Z2Y7_9BACL|nr:phytanoyl-CoA dioxygenase family protein [Paenibacillus cellulosilyticus]PWW03194.1 phytanoyl-CoA dioxygenase PhyH [Paenibacillus cellulosilyticus]QKS43684.1 phytanoyl-CoA dioxygenase family protein [Paenibacillus cellulosilyticus]
MRDSNELPSLSALYDISNEDIKQYRNEGHVMVRSLATKEEVNAYRVPIKSVMDRLSKEGRPKSERYVYDNALLQGMNLWRRHPDICKFVFARRFANVAARLLGANKVYIKHDCALFKEPGAPHTPLHQDQRVWPISTSKTITMWMPLIDLSEKMGSMSFYSGTHLWGDIGTMTEKVAIKTVRARSNVVNYGPMKVGDATFHAGWLLHGAPANFTDTTREVMTIVYMADHVEVIDCKGDLIRETHLRRYLPGLKAGDLAITELNPLVWPS